MKAIEINSQIKTYNTLPQSWGNVLGGFNLLSDEELKSYGFYNISIPDYDSRVSNASDLFFDSSTETFTKTITSRTWDESLSELKTYQINAFNNEINSKLSETDWYIVRNQETGADIPADITTARQELRDQSAKVESEINLLTTKEDVMSYNLPIII
jgi:hypothetical protein